MLQVIVWVQIGSCLELPATLLHAGCPAMMKSVLSIRKLMNK